MRVGNDDIPTHHEKGSDHMTSCIYAIYGPNDKVYIGSAIDVNRRWANHRHYLEQGTHYNLHLQRAWKKHGANAFAFAVVEKVAIAELLIEREQSHLDHWFGSQPEQLYNVRRTAESNFGLRHSTETRRKMSQSGKVAHRGRTLSEKERQHLTRMSASNKGRKRSPEFCRRISERQRNLVVSAETRRKLALANIGKRQSRETVEKRINAVTGGRRCTFVSPTGETFTDVINVSAFAREHGLDATCLRRVSIGKARQHQGWIGYRQEAVTADEALMAPPTKSQEEAEGGVVAEQKP